MEHVVIHVLLIRRTYLTTYGPDGISADCTGYDQDLVRDAPIAELADCADAVRSGVHALGFDGMVTFCLWRDVQGGFRRGGGRGRGRGPCVMDGGH